MKNDNDNEMLYRAILSLKTVDECRAFFTDLCTYNEVKAMSQRLEVAKMLYEKQVYNKIVEKTSASSATVSRVNRSLTHGAGGYPTVLGRIKE